MQNRIPTYPGRVTLTPVTGQTNTYDLVRADEPTEAGTPLNKATLLSDDAVTALTGAGLTLDEDTPSGAFEAIAGVIGNNANAPKMEIKTYDGAGNYGSSHPCSLSFSFAPDLFIMLGHSTGSSWNDYLGWETRMGLTVIRALLTSSYTNKYGFYRGTGIVSYSAKFDENTNTLSWYTSYSEAAQFNEAGNTYYVLGIKF